MTGYVFDSDNPPHPIEGAMIRGYTRLRNIINNEGDTIGEFDSHYTFTDETGKFSLIPYDYNPEPPDYNSIEVISISAPGCSRVRSECWNCENGIPNNQTFILNKTDLKYQDIYENLIIQGGGNLLQAWDKVYLKNISIQQGAACEIKARTEIYVDVEFFALEGSETWIHTDETFAQCEKISSSYSKNTIVNEPFVEEKNEISREIQLNFLPIDKGLEFNIYPNPSSGLFTLQITEPESFSDIILILFDQFGKEILQRNLTGNKENINLTGLSKGIYYIRLYNSEYIGYKKLIVI